MRSFAVFGKKEEKQNIPPKSGQNKILQTVRVWQKIIHKGIKLCHIKITTGIPM